MGFLMESRGSVMGTTSFMASALLILLGLTRSPLESTADPAAKTFAAGLAAREGVPTWPATI